MTVPNLSFGGLAAPFDVNAVIDQLIQAESIPLQNLQATRQSYQSKDAAWGSILTKVSSLRTAVDDLSFDEHVTATSSDETAAVATVTGTPSPGGLTFDIVQLAAAHTVHSDATFSSTDDTVGAGTFTLTVDGNDHTLTLDGSETLDDLVGLIDGLDVGVDATALQSGTDEYRLLLTATETGEDNAFSVTSTIVGFTGFTTVVTGANAQIEIGEDGLLGGPLVVERSSNTFSDVLSGVSFDVRAVQDNVTISVERDLEGSGTGVNDLVAKLNGVLGELDTLTSYDATSGAAGILAGDSTARSLKTTLRSAVSGAVGADPTNYVGPAIGIEITRTGSFTFDQEKFEEALASDYDGVKAFVEDVVLANLDTELDAAEGIDGSIARARDRWQNQIDFMDDRIADFEDRLDRKEAALIRQFSALEVSLQSLSSQSAWLASQVAGFNGGG